MKKSASVTLGLLAAAAMVGATGCRRTEVRDCVDQTRSLVSDSLCEQEDQWDESGRTGYNAQRLYFWSYGGATGGHLGDTVVGGHSSPTSGSAVVGRGGFGGSMDSGGS
jgi:uncharacterized protein YgiB involved in biofilm formation